MAYDIINSKTNAKVQTTTTFLAACKWLIKAAPTLPAGVDLVVYESIRGKWRLPLECEVTFNVEFIEEEVAA